MSEPAKIVRKRPAEYIAIQYTGGEENIKDICRLFQVQGDFQVNGELGNIKVRDADGQWLLVFEGYWIIKPHFVGIDQADAFGREPVWTEYNSLLVLGDRQFKEYFQDI